MPAVFASPCSWRFLPGGLRAGPARLVSGRLTATLEPVKGPGWIYVQPVIATCNTDKMRFCIAHLSGFEV